jgi:hypothetical protein
MNGAVRVGGLSPAIAQEFWERGLSRTRENEEVASGSYDHVQSPPKRAKRAKISRAWFWLPLHIEQWEMAMHGGDYFRHDAGSWQNFQVALFIYAKSGTQCLDQRWIRFTVSKRHQP